MYDLDTYLIQIEEQMEKDGLDSRKFGSARARDASTVFGLLRVRVLRPAQTGIQLRPRRLVPPFPTFF